jgi:NitT/TauT family transport system substrate-binding protein
VRARAWSAVAAAVLATAATAAGCSSSSGGSAAETASMPIVTGLESTDITVADSPAIDSAGLYIAEHLGLFAREGLHVTVVPDFTSSQDTVDQIESGKAQVSSGDYVTYMNDFAGTDPNLEIIGEGSILEPNVLALMTGPGSKVTSLKQLAGKTLPVSASHDITNLLIDSVLAGNNVPVDSVKYRPGEPLSKVPSMIASGAFVTGPVSQPFITIGEQQAGDAVLADMDQGGTTNFPIQGYAVTKHWAQQNPNTLKAFATALDEGQELADTDRSTLEQALLAQKFLRLTPGVVGVISTPSFPTAVDPVRIQRVMDEMLQYGFYDGQGQAKELAAAKAFNAQNVVYQANVIGTSGRSNLLSAGE